MSLLVGCNSVELEKINQENEQETKNLQFSLLHYPVGKYENSTFTPTICDADLEKCFAQIATSKIHSIAFKEIAGGYYLSALDDNARLYLGLDWDGPGGYMRLNGTDVTCVGDCNCGWDGTACVCAPGESGTCSRKFSGAGA